MSVTPTPSSPYARALGERVQLLHPTLQQYFSSIPAGHVGVGEGVFRQAGTPRRWLWPVLRPTQRRGVLFAGWEKNVAFRVTNRTVASRSIAERAFELPRGTWTMRDAVALTQHGRVVDELGEPSTVVASFDVDVRDGALVLTSRRVGIRLGLLRMRLPRFLSPVARLTESFDDNLQRQRVNLTIDAPLLGRVYEYAVDFAYRIEKEQR